MRITIELLDSLWKEAKKLAAKEGSTIRALVERGLRRVVAERKSRGAFRLRTTSFPGKGRQSSLEPPTWERIRESIYKGRGG
jgi:predicted DNA-binding ribbon-helix-helix protein